MKIIEYQVLTQNRKLTQSKQSSYIFFMKQKLECFDLKIIDDEDFEYFMKYLRES
jgi:hypothetical protein